MTLARRALTECLAALTAVQQLNVELDYGALTSKASREIAQAKASAREAIRELDAHPEHVHALLTTPTPGVYRCEECGVLVHAPDA